MATRFYLPHTGVAAASPAVGALWDHTASLDRRPMSRTASNTALANKSNVITVPSIPYDSLLRQFVSEALTINKNITGTFSFVTRAQTAFITDDKFMQIRLSVCSGDGTVERGVLYAGTLDEVVGASGTPSHEIGGSQVSRIYNNIAVTPVNAVAGDRIVAEIGWRACATRGTTSTFNMRFGDPNAVADLALSVDVATDLRPWLEFSSNIFVVDDAGSYTDNLRAAQSVPPVQSTSDKMYEYWKNLSALPDESSMDDHKKNATGTWFLKPL